VADGLLMTRRERTSRFFRNLAGAFGPSALLALFALVAADAVLALVIAVLGGLVALAIATSVRTARGALTGGVTVALALVLMQIVLAWFLSHPVLPG
jgi:hypothetical protein